MIRLAIPAVRRMVVASRKDPITYTARQVRNAACDMTQAENTLNTYSNILVVLGGLDVDPILGLHVEQVVFREKPR